MNDELMEMPDPELIYLVDGIIDGTLSIPEQRQLENRLKEEPEAAEYCAQRLTFDSELSECLNPVRLELTDNRQLIIERHGKSQKMLVTHTKGAQIGSNGREGFLGLPQQPISPGGIRLLYLWLALIPLMLVGLGYFVLKHERSLETSNSNNDEEFRPDFQQVKWQRPPKSEEDLKYWLENMVWYHQFSSDEISLATGLTEQEISSALERLNISHENHPPRNKERLLALPYPGGRHPRIGETELAINPQRETKVTVFPPWEDGGYAVLDLPEAIRIGETYFYIAHSDLSTIWERQNIVLPALEWSRKDDGILESSRNLPNGIAFRAKVTPMVDHLKLDFWLTNGSGGPLQNIHIQNCLLLGNLEGFKSQAGGNLYAWGNYSACRNGEENRWIITAWEHVGKNWGIKECPCLHADPILPLIRKGETIRLQGLVSFYEGQNIGAEFKRIEKTGWIAK
ncbi:MAG: hypothetical protein L7T84_14585 [Akkermansiaceae bacterium]|nr:hypothetical protein [Akkermansiaceae bacterium]